MSRELKNPEQFCTCETEQNLNLIISNIEERQKVVNELEQ